MCITCSICYSQLAAFHLIEIAISTLTFMTWFLFIVNVRSFYRVLQYAPPFLFTCCCCCLFRDVPSFQVGSTPRPLLPLFIHRVLVFYLPPSHFLRLSLIPYFASLYASNNGLGSTKPPPIRADFLPPAEGIRGCHPISFRLLYPEYYPSCWTSRTVKLRRASKGMSYDELDRAHSFGHPSIPMSSRSSPLSWSSLAPTFTGLAVVICSTLPAKNASSHFQQLWCPEIVEIPAISFNLLILIYAWLCTALDISQILYLSCVLMQPFCACPPMVVVHCAVLRFFHLPNYLSSSNDDSVWRLIFSFKPYTGPCCTVPLRSVS